MNRYDFKTIHPIKEQKENNKKYNFTPSKECDKVTKKRADDTLTHTSLNKIMRFKKDGDL